MRVAVYGAGGVGGFLAARLAAGGGAEVHLLARGEHLAALRRDGLTLRSVHGDAHAPLPATDDPATVGPVDVVLFTVKSTDTPEAARRIGALLHDDTAVVCFQNGVRHLDELTAAIGRRHVLGGAAFIFATIAEPGVIEHTGGPTRFVIGELDPARHPRAVRLAAAFEAAGLRVEASDDIEAVVWRKFVFICAQAGMTAAARLPIGALRRDDAAWAMFRRVLEEVRAVGAAQGVDLGEEAVTDALALAESLDDTSTSSLYYDLVHHKPLELERLNGDVVRRARHLGIPVPANEAIAALLSPWARPRDAAMP